MHWEIQIGGGVPGGEASYIETTFLAVAPNKINEPATTRERWKYHGRFLFHVASDKDLSACGERPVRIGGPMLTQ